MGKPPLAADGGTAQDLFSFSGDDLLCTGGRPDLGGEAETEEEDEDEDEETVGTLVGCIDGD